MNNTQAPILILESALDVNLTNSAFSLYGDVEYFSRDRICHDGFSMASGPPFPRSYCCLSRGVAFNIVIGSPFSPR